MTTQETRQAKKALRSDYKKRRNEIQPSQRKILDEKICKNITDSVSFEYADVVLVFYPTAYEIDIKRIFDYAKEKGKRLAFPRCISRGVMKFYFPADEQSFERSAYGILEPKEDCEEFFCKDFKHPLCIVPSLAACLDGSRLGYGGGFYDRFLSDFNGISMCVQYEEFICDSLPFEKRYDKKVDAVVTEKAVYVVGTK